MGSAFFDEGTEDSCPMKGSGVRPRFRTRKNRATSNKGVRNLFVYHRHSHTDAAIQGKGGA